MRRRAWILICLLFSALSILGTGGSAAEKKTAEAVIWKYIDNEFARASADPSYWHKRWHLESAPKRTDFRLGRPYSEYCLNPPQLEAFVRSGDLLGSAFIMDVAHPVFCNDQLVGSIGVVPNDTTGWEFSGRHSGGPYDSLAVAFVDRGDSVAFLSGDYIGVVMLVIPAGTTETRVYPLAHNSPLASHADSQGMVSYAVACDVLRPLAKEWLDHNRKRPEHEHQE